MKTVKRKAKVGERILITNKARIETRYENGNIGDVTKSNSAGIFAKINLETCGIFHEEYEVIIEEADGMKKIIVENLVGHGMKAVVTGPGKCYTTYSKFAIDAGYPDAVENAKVSEGEKSAGIWKLKNRTVEILARGKHGTFNDLIYVIEANNGDRYLIGADGIQLIENKTEVLRKGVIEQMQAEINELKSKVAALEEAKVSGKLATIHKGDLILPNLNCRHTIKPKSPQQIRDEIVAKAKAYVASIVGEYEGFRTTIGRFDNQLVIPKFFVNKEKRAVTVLIYGELSQNLLLKGIAKADPSDCFNVHIGKAIALRRALGLEVPSEYYNAPAPTEVRVGDVILRRGDYASSNGLRTVKAIEKSVHYRGKMFYRTEDIGGTDEHNVVRIVDDSRE